jgi:hypothetical protein
VRRFGRIAQGACGQSWWAIRASAPTCGRCAANDSLILVRSFSTRQAIFNNSARMVANVAPRQRNLFGDSYRLKRSAARRSA